MSSIELGIERPAHGGSCVGRHDGRVVFCRLALPGETVSADVQGEDPGARFWRAEATAVIADANPDRVDPDCPWFVAGGCGGCSWLHASPPLQKQIKQDVLRETLDRIGKVVWDPPVTSLGTERGWRTKVTLHVDDQGRAGLRPARSNAVIPVTDCLQADPRLQLPAILETTWPPGAQVQVSVSAAGRSVLVRSDGKTTVEGPRVHHEIVRGRRFEYPVDGFWQSHRDAAQVLADRVVDAAGVQDGMRVADLYGGVGLFGLTLLDTFQGGSVTIVEGDRESARFARRNAGDAPRVTVIQQDVRRWATAGPQDLDVVVLDPPRAGAGAPVLKAVAAARPATIVYVSCEPSTLARDLAVLRGAGFLPDAIEGLDIFPGTAAVETVVRLRSPGLPGNRT